MYCPKCDIDFSEDTRECTSCGGPLIAKDEWLSEQEMYESENGESSSDEHTLSSMPQESQASSETTSDESDLIAELSSEEKNERDRKVRGRFGESTLYISSSDKYKDHMGSAQSFAFLAIILSLGATYTSLQYGRSGGIPIMPIVLLVMALISFIIAFKAYKDGKAYKARIQFEEFTRAKIQMWFTDKYSADAIMKKTLDEYGPLSPELEALRHIQLIQDILSTGGICMESPATSAIDMDDDMKKLLSDRSFVENIADEIYEELFANNDSEYFATAPTKEASIYDGFDVTENDTIDAIKQLADNTDTASVTDTVATVDISYTSDVKDYTFDDVVDIFQSDDATSESDITHASNENTSTIEIDFSENIPTPSDEVSEKGTESDNGQVIDANSIDDDIIVVKSTSLDNLILD